MPSVPYPQTADMKLGTSPSCLNITAPTVSGINNPTVECKLGVSVKWPSSEELSASRPKSSAEPSASYFRNRRSSLPVNSLSVARPRTSLHDVFRARPAEDTTLRELDSSTAKTSTKPDSFQRFKRTSSLSQNCRHLAELMKARSAAISRLSMHENSDDVINEDEQSDDDIQVNDKKEISPRPPERPPGTGRGRPGARRGSTPCFATRPLQADVTPHPKRTGSLSPSRRPITADITSKKSPSNKDEDGGFSLGNLLAAKTSGKNNSTSKQQKPRDTLTNLQRRQSIKEFDPDVLFAGPKIANKESNIVNDKVPEHMRKVTWNRNNVSTKSTTDFALSRKSSPSDRTSDRSSTPAPWQCRQSRRTETEIAEQVEAELQIRITDRRRQLKNMMKLGRRLNAIQMIGPRAHQSTKMLEHLPGSRLRKVLDDMDHKRPTNDLIKVRIETLKKSQSI